MVVARERRGGCKGADLSGFANALDPFSIKGNIMAKRALWLGRVNGAKKIHELRIQLADIVSAIWAIF